RHLQRDAERVQRLQRVVGQAGDPGVAARDDRALVVEAELDPGDPDCAYGRAPAALALLAVGDGAGHDADALELDDPAEQRDVAQRGPSGRADLVVAGRRPADGGQAVDLDQPGQPGDRVG